MEGSLPSNWQVHDLLPIDPSFLPDVPVGNTPLWPAVRLNQQFPGLNLWLKDETAQPTGSLKDRASFLVAGAAKQFGIREISLASTGNAGASMAGIGAACDLDIILFLPASAPKAKLVQALHYGATLWPVDGNYDRAFELSQQYFQERGGITRNTAQNPLTIEGKKTVSLEIFQQMGRVPDHVFVSVGDGVIISGVIKGFQDLLQLGLVDKMPVVHGVQAEGSDALCRLMAENFEAKSTHSVADSIVVDVPRCGYRAKAYLQQHGGRCHRVSDEAILDAQHFIARQSGLFTEPAGAAAMAGFLTVHQELEPDTHCVLLMTGHGLKDMQAASQSIDFPNPIASLDDMRSVT